MSGNMLRYAVQLRVFSAGRDIASRIGRRNCAWYGVESPRLWAVFSHHLGDELGSQLVGVLACTIAQAVSSEVSKMTMRMVRSAAVFGECEWTSAYRTRHQGHQRGPTIADQWQRDADDREEAAHHPGVDEQVDEEHQRQ